MLTATVSSSRQNSWIQLNTGGPSWHGFNGVHGSIGATSPGVGRSIVGTDGLSGGVDGTVGTFGSSASSSGSSG
jgi:hypothetical protein